MSSPLPARQEGLERYKGLLPQLIHVLTQELSEKARGTWARRQLLRGAVVSLMRDPGDGRRVLFLSRPDPSSEAAWQAEVEGTFLHWFNAERWVPELTMPPGADRGLRVAVWSAYREPHEG